MHCTHYVTSWSESTRRKKNPYGYTEGEHSVHKARWHTTMLHIQERKLWAMLTPKSHGANSRITLGRRRLTDSDLTIHPHCNKVYAWVCVLVCTIYAKSDYTNTGNIKQKSVKTNKINHYILIVLLLLTIY